VYKRQTGVGATFDSFTSELIIRIFNLLYRNYNIYDFK
jgi:hypothetical protein